MTNLYLHILFCMKTNINYVATFLFFHEMYVTTVEVRLNVCYKSNKWTLTPLCTYCNCMWSIVHYMKDILFSLRLLIVNLCNWVTFVYIEVNLRNYISKLYMLKECMFLKDVWYNGSKKTRLNTFFMKKILHMNILYNEW